MKNLLTKVGLLSGLMTVGAITVSSPASAQFLPQAWGAVGYADEDITFAVGGKWISYGVEVGLGEDEVVGVDVLRFLTSPGVSPYVGVGLYSGNDVFAYSGGVHYTPRNANIFVGAGYHSIRGINGQLGIRF